MTPAQFCVWLSGYASAKPETLDPKIQTELDAIIADMVASKLSGAYEDAELELRKMKHHYEHEMQKMQLDAMRQAQIAKSSMKMPSLSGGIVYASNTNPVQGSNDVIQLAAKA